MPLGEGVAYQPTVTVDGAALPVDVLPLLESVVVDDGLQVPDLLLLRFRDDHGAVLSKTGIRIGSTLQVGLSTHNARERADLLKAEVTALECDVDVDGVHVVVRALDGSHRLLAGRRVEAYVNVTASDVVEQVARRAGLDVGRVQATDEVHEQLTQDGVSDWDFLRRLALENGRVVRVEDRVLDFVEPRQAAEAPTRGAPTTEPLSLARGDNLQQLKALVTASGLVPEVQVRGWDPKRKRAVVSTAQPVTRTAELDTVTPARLASVFRPPALVQAVSSYRTQRQCETVARALADRVSGGFAEVEGRARGNAALRAGSPVVLSGVGQPFDGRYTLTSTRHEWTPERGYVTWFTASGASERSLWGALQPASDPAVAHGPVSAVVSDNKDPDGLGRVKVTFPVLSDTYKSAWARVVSGGGGAQRGAAIVPEVNDEVLVVFGQGRMDEPYVVGGLHNGEDKPGAGSTPAVDATSGRVQRRAFTSRTGMVVEMVESQDQAHLTVSNAGGAQKVSLVEKPDKAIEIVSEGTVQVTAKGDVSVTTAAGSLSVEAAKVAVKAQGALTLEGMTVSVKATGSAELSATGPTTVRGAVVKIN